MQGLMAANVAAEQQREREAMTKVEARITNEIQRAQSSNEPGNGGRAGGRVGISDLGFHWVLGLGHLSFAD
jgi:hypothetical protein